MPEKSKKIRIVATLVLASGALGINLHSSHADGNTALPGLAIVKLSDGTAPFDAAAGIGADTNATNGIVRAGDVAVLRFDNSLNDSTTATATTYQHLTITTSSLPLGFRFSGLPVECTASGSSLAGDGVVVASSMTCDMGAKDTGSAWSVTASVAALPTVAEGTVATVNATLTAQGVTTTAPASAPAITATSATKIDLQLGAPRPVGAKLVNGQAGYVYVYSLGLKLKPGSEAPALPVVLSNDISGISPNARLVGCGVNGAMITGLDWAYGFGMPLGKPGGLYGRFKGNLTNSVEDSGLIACTPRATTPTIIDVSLSGIHTTPNSFPTKTSDSLDVTPGDHWIASDYIAVWVPITDFNNTNGFQRVAINKLNEFAPTGATSHGVNFGNPTAEPGAGVTNLTTAGQATLTGTENWYQSTIERPNIGFIETYDLKFHDYFTGAGMTGAMSSGVTYAEPVGSDYRTGDGVVAAGVRYTALNDVFLKGVVDLPKGFINCMTLDNRYTTVTSLPGIANQGAYVWGRQSAAQQAAAGWVVEYGVGGVGGSGTTWATAKDRQLGTCANNQSTNGVWYASLDTVPGGAKNVTKVRARTTNVYSAADQLAEIEATHLGGVYSRLVVELVANDITPAGEHAANYQKAFDPSGTWLNGWYQSDYDEQTATGGLGDRVTAVGTRVRVTAATSATVIAPNTTQTITLAPTSDALGVSPAGKSLNVTITQTLAASLAYQAGSTVCGAAQAQPTACEPTVTNNGSTLTWSFGDIVAGSTLSTLAFKVSTNTTAVDGSSAALTTVVSATNDNSASEWRTANVGLTISNPGALSISTTAVTPLADVGTPVTFNLRVQNVAAAPVGQTDFIDWLPYNGDTRAPATSNHGTTTLQSIAQTSGGIYNVLYTATDPATLRLPADLDPATVNPAIVWCTKAKFGTSGCPATIDKVTGLRLQSSAPVAAQELDSFDVTMTQQVGTVDVNNDHLTNRFRGRAKGLVAVVESNNATTSIAAAQIGSTVWNDTNQNGVRETGEPGVSGTTVQLLSDTGAVVGTTSTDATGKYTLKNLKHGSYRLKFVAPAGRNFTFAPDHRGVASTDSDVDPVTGVTPAVPVPSGSVQPAIDAGFIDYGPRVSLLYSINDNDANTSPGVAVKKDSKMSLTFDVTNTGNATLVNPRLSTNRVGGLAVSCPKKSLAPTETMRCTATKAAPEDKEVFSDLATIVMSPQGTTTGVAASDIRATDVAYAHRFGDGKDEKDDKADETKSTGTESKDDKDAKAKEAEDAKAKEAEKESESSFSSESERWY